MRRLFSLLASITLAAAFSFGMSGSLVRAADDCASLRAQIFGTGPSDMQSAAYKYKNYKTALERTKRALETDEENLETARKVSAAYYVNYGRTNTMFELRLRADTERVREDRANMTYFSGKLSAAASNLRRLNAEYKKLGCAANKPGGGSTSENWSGTYVDNAAHQLEITGSGATFTADSKWSPSETQGGSATWNCEANGSTAKCKGSGKYFDPDKTITVTLETTLRKSGSTIRETDKVLTSSCKPEKIADCKDLGYTPAVHAGAELPAITLRRQ